MIRVNSNDFDFLSEIKTCEQKSCSIVLKYMDTEEIIFTTKKINFEQKYIYVPEISEINVIINGSTVELIIIIKYNLKKHQKTINLL
jgi:hypothetical protein